MTTSPSLDARPGRVASLPNGPGLWALMAIIRALEVLRRSLGIETGCAILIFSSYGSGALEPLRACREGLPQGLGGVLLAAS